MSAPDESPGEPSDDRGAEDDRAAEFDAESVGGLGELVPEPLRPVWSRVESVQEFRRTHGETYVTALEAVVAAALAGGYLYWLFLYLTA